MERLKTTQRKVKEQTLQTPFGGLWWVSPLDTSGFSEIKCTTKKKTAPNYNKILDKLWMDVGVAKKPYNYRKLIDYGREV
jgi:hypothetical protein